MFLVSVCLSAGSNRESLCSLSLSVCLQALIESLCVPCLCLSAGSNRESLCSLSLSVCLQALIESLCVPCLCLSAGSNRESLCSLGCVSQLMSLLQWPSLSLSSLTSLTICLGCLVDNYCTSVHYLSPFHIWTLYNILAHTFTIHIPTWPSIRNILPIHTHLPLPPPPYIHIHTHLPTHIAHTYTITWPHTHKIHDTTVAATT